MYYYVPDTRKLIQNLTVQNCIHLLRNDGGSYDAYISSSEIPQKLTQKLLCILKTARVQE